MKKNLFTLILICASIIGIMAANETRHNSQMAKARGQPKIQSLPIMAYENFVFTNAEIGLAEIGVAIAETYPAETPYRIGTAVNAANQYVLKITEGDRKVRDVDSCSKGEDYTTNDKRIALHTKTVKLPRGLVLCGSLLN